MDGDKELIDKLQHVWHSARPFPQEPWDRIIALVREHDGRRWERLHSASKNTRALDWTPITAGNLPKGPSGDYAGDEVLTLRKKDGAVIQIHAASCKWSCLDHDEDSPYADFMRPINPPQEPS